MFNNLFTNITCGSAQQGSLLNQYAFHKSAISTAISFSDDCANNYLKSLVTDIRLYGANKTHTYILRYVEIKEYRCRFIIRDLTTGIDVAGYVLVATIPDYTSLEPVWKLTDTAISVDSKVYAVIKIDWSKAVRGDYNYTTTIEAGINQNALYDYTDVSDFLTKHIYHEKITVGSGKDFATLRAAVESLYYSTSKSCWRSCYHHQILIEIDEGTYNSTDLVIPEYVMLKGAGKDVTFIEKENDLPEPIFESHLETKMFDMTIVSDTGDGGTWLGEYCIHSDDINLHTNSNGFRRIFQVFKGLKLLGGYNQRTWLFGCGISSGYTIKFYDCEGGHNQAYSASVSTFGFHTTTGSWFPANLIMEKCSSTDTNSASGLALAITSNSGQINTALLKKCGFLNAVSNSEWNVVIF